MGTIMITDTPEKVLASILSVTREDIQRALIVVNKYTIKRIPKKDGGFRKVYIPHRNLLFLQKKIRKYLVREWPHWFVGSYGVFKKTSYITHVEYHAENRYFFQMDLKNAFPSAKTENIFPYLFERTFRITNNKPLSKKITDLILLFTTYKGILPQGTTTAPFLFYILLGESGILDELSKLRTDLRVSLYIDNFLFSSKKPISKLLKKRIQKILKNRGLKVNPEKTSYHDKKYDSFLVNGLRIDNNRVILPKKEIRRIRALLHRSLFEPELQKVALGTVAALLPIYKHVPRQLLESYCKLKAHIW